MKKIINMLDVRFYVQFLMAQKSFTKALDVLKKDIQTDTMPYDRKQMIAECLSQQANDVTCIEQANAIYAYLIESYR